MPELPEAEANRRRVEAGALNRTITGFSLHNTTHLDLPPPKDRDRLEGRQFTEARRHGKMIFAGSSDGPWIAVHLGMTGSLHTFDAPRDMDDKARIVVEFEGDRRLVFYNPRKFGWMKVCDDPGDVIREAEAGPDALEIGEKAFAEVIGGTRGAVKSALIDQKKLAGIGNLWSDEILFQTGVAPETRANSLSAEALRDLHKAMRRILQAVVDTGADYSELPDTWLIGRREDGASCPRCKGTISKKTVGGRSAYFCDTHQGDGT